MELQSSYTKLLQTILICTTKKDYTSHNYKTPNEVYCQAINNLDIKGEKLLPLVS
jgi:hypothetical protein